MELAVADVNDNTLTGAENFMSILTQYRENNVVAGTSVWYLPSYAELKLMQDNYAVVSASMVKVGASLPQDTNLFVGRTSSSLKGYFRFTLAF